jgi:flavin reductase (DIM6/NTAB) family NADH-FMN oxidoreductase RutF
MVVFSEMLGKKKTIDHNSEVQRRMTMDHATTYLTKVDINSLQFNPCIEIGRNWMLITGGSPDAWNTMTASWGGMGHLWNKDVCFIFVRRNRHTWKFIQEGELFALSFFDASWKKALAYCGSVSGRDVDKTVETGLQPLALPGGSVAFRQARFVVECRKLYTGQIAPEGFLDPSVLDFYPEKQWHDMYVGEIIGLFSGRTE